MLRIQAALRWVAIRLAVVLVMLAVAALVLRQMTVLDRQFIYFPERELIGIPSDVGLKFEEVVFSASDDVRLHGWFVPGNGDTVLLWFHGNAGNISHRLDNIRMLHDRLGVDVFIFDYRGYGNSQGKPSEKGIYLDAEAAIEEVRQRQRGRLVLFGRSLGCGVAVEMGARHSVDAVILESPFSSVKDMIRLAYPLPPADIAVRLIEARYDSIAKISDVRAPVLVLHGDRDEIVPLGQSRRLFDAANEPKSFYTIEGAGHNDTYLVGGDPYIEALGRFIRDPDATGE